MSKNTIKIEKRDNKYYLVSEFETGNKQWLARITGLNDKYKFDRIFLNSTRQGLKINEIHEGDIIEHVRFSHSGKNRDNRYYIFTGGTLKEITEEEVIFKFKN